MEQLAQGKRLRAYQATEENFTSLRRGKEIWLDRLVSWIGFVQIFVILTLRLQETIKLVG